MALSIEDALEVVKLRNLSDVAFFHRLESMCLPKDFAIGYSLEELRRTSTYNPEKVAIEYAPLVKVLSDFKKQKPTNRRILDFGSGAGTLARYLHENQFEIETADNQPISVATAREVNKLATYLVTTPENLEKELQDRKYGLIMLNRVLEQPVMDEETASHLLHHLAKRLDKEGYFVISTATGIILLDAIQRSFERVEEIDITPTSTVKKIYKITPTK